MLNAGEDVMRKVIGRLQEKGLWENTIMIYASDNGAPSGSYHSNGILAGNKNTLWEGGVRTPSFVYSANPSLIPAGTSTSCLFHVSDWYPTLIALSGGWEAYYTDTGTLPTEGIDGIDQSYLLTSASTTCQRNEVFLNVDPVKRVGGYIRGHMKLLVGNQNDESASCDTGKYYPLNEDSMDSSILQLYNITSDPGETTELSTMYPDTTADMLEALQKFAYEGNPLLCEFATVDGSYPSDEVPFVVPWEFVESDVWTIYAFQLFDTGSFFFFLEAVSTWVEMKDWNHRVSFPRPGGLCDLIGSEREKGRKREREREKDRQRERKKEREKTGKRFWDREEDSGREREREGERWRGNVLSERERERGRVREKESERESERERSVNRVHAE
eukprot:sb/3465576/